MRPNWGEWGLVDLPRGCKNPVTETKQDDPETVGGARIFGDTYRLLCSLPPSPPISSAQQTCSILQFFIEKSHICTAFPALT